MQKKGGVFVREFKEIFEELGYTFPSADVLEDVYTFYRYYNNEANKPEKTQKNVEFLGTTLVNDKHVISLQNDRGSSYQAYISVQNELVAAYNELRDELALQKWQRPYAELNDEQQKAIREIYPQRISEAEPKKYGEKKK